MSCGGEGTGGCTWNLQPRWRTERGKSKRNGDGEAETKDNYVLNRERGGGWEEWKWKRGEMKEKVWEMCMDPWGKMCVGSYRTQTV